MRRSSPRFASMGCSFDPMRSAVCPSIWKRAASTACSRHVHHHIGTGIEVNGGFVLFAIGGGDAPFEVSQRPREHVEIVGQRRA